MKKHKSIQIPTVVAFFYGMLKLFIGSLFFAAIFSLGEPANIVTLAPKIFVTAFAAQMILGMLRIRVHQKGVAYDDSLVVSDTTYSGTFAPYFILPALYGMDTYEKGCLYFKDGIKKKHTIGKMDFSNPLQARVPTPTQSGGDITITGNVLDPQDVMVYQEFNPRDLEVHFTAEDLSASLLTRQLPPTVENYVTLLITQRAFEQYENGIWMGSTAYTAATGSTGNGQLKFFNGFMTRFISDSSVYQTTSPVTLTSSNVIAAMQDLYQAAATTNKALVTKATKYQRMKMLVSINTDLIYEEALAATTYKNQNTTEKGIRQFKGFEVVPLAGMPDNTIIFTESISSNEGNLWLGMNSILDENFTLMRTQNNSELFFLKMLMKMDVNYGFANKVFCYTTLTAGTFTA